MEVQHGPGLTPWGSAEPSPEELRRERRRRAGLVFVRYGVPALIAVAGIVVMVVPSDRDTALEVGSMFLGAAVAVLLLNVFFRIGVAGDLDRDREEEARDYFDRHGRWPDEPKT